MILVMNGVRFYSVLFPGKHRFRASAEFTYKSGLNLDIGDAVLCPFGAKSEFVGIVTGDLEKPDFEVKEISELKMARLVDGYQIELARFLSHYYATPIGKCLDLFVNLKLVARVSGAKDEKWILKRMAKFDELRHEADFRVKDLSEDQIGALERVKNSGKIMLVGETGSGKTEVYLRAAEDALSGGKSVLILVPEIGLSPQALDRFSELGCPIIEVNSSKTGVERMRIWQLIRGLDEAGKPFVLVGPRSCLFMPLVGVGLIVVDECHDSSYKQQTEPKYSAVILASKLAGDLGAKLILGSATPNVSDYYFCEQKGYEIIELKKRSGQNASIEILSMKDEPGVIFSKKALAEMETTLAKGQQIMVFHNRRGSMRLVICGSCTWQADCGSCFIPLIYHGDRHKMICHSCGRIEGVVSVCPKCRGGVLDFKGTGTKQIELDLRKRFPGADVRRFDLDNTKISEKLSSNYADIIAGEVDIIVGTKAITKGLDIPNLALVIVPSADSELGLPDEFTREGGYQILSQVAGRVGRGHTSEAGRVLIQSYNPSSEILGLVRAGSWQDFYQFELAERRKILLTPFRFELKIEGNFLSEDAAKRALNYIIRKLRAEVEGGAKLMVLGPTPCFRARKKDRYAYQILVRSSSRKILLNCVKLIPAGKHYRFELDPVSHL